MFDSFEVMRKMYLGKTIVLNPTDSSELKILAKVLDVNPAGMILEPVRERCGHSARINTTIEVSKGKYVQTQRHCIFYDWRSMTSFCMVGETDGSDSMPSETVGDEVRHALMVGENEIKKFSYSQSGSAFEKE